MPNIIDYIKNESTMYVEDLMKFVASNKLEEYLKNPIDHISLKTQDTKDFEGMMEELTPFLSEGGIVHIHNRRMALVKLKEEIEINILGVAINLEIAEPRPEKVGKDFVGLEHIEILFPDIDSLVKYAIENNIQYELNENEMHKAIFFKINDKGQEVKFPNNTFDSMIKFQKGKNNFVSLEM